MIAEETISLRKHSFFAIAFANYVEMQDDFKQSFADWLKVSCITCELLHHVRMLMII